VPDSVLVGTGSGVENSGD